jgi:hypothetical protein
MQTAYCPKCKKDSYVPEREAFFIGGTCTWCGVFFKYDIKSDSYKVMDKKEDKK